MREIKFRGLRTDGKGWVYGYYYEYSGKHIICWQNHSDNATTDHFAEVIPETVGQFTGLKDLQGNNIFEGDVILNSFKIKQKETKEERLIEGKIIVEWKHQEEDYEQSHFYGYDVRDGKDVEYNNVYWDCLEMKYEVIGNIHEPIND